MFKRLVQPRFVTVQLQKLVWSRLFHATCISQQNDAEEDVLLNNPYYEKYAEKIRVAKKDGVYVPKKEDKRLAKEREQWRRKMREAEGSLDDMTQSGEKAGSKLPLRLDELMKTELLLNKNVDEITAIWSEYFKTKDSVAAIIPSQDYKKFLERSQSYPLFLYPLPKPEGYEFVLSQFTNDSRRCFFTSLINFQVHGDSAPWQLSLVYYTELSESKGVVLMAGEIDAKAMNVMEAQCLCQLQQMFYATTNKKRLELLEKFNLAPSSFKHMDLVKEMIKYLWKRYVYYLTNKPWPTNIITAGVTYIFGDLIAQKGIEGRPWKDYDKKRTAKLVVIGCVVVAPSLLIWYRILDTVFKGSSAFALKKVVIDQLIFSPYILAAMFATTHASDGGTANQLKEKLALVFFPTLCASYKFWPFVQTMNFFFIPHAFRILFVRFAAVVWNSYLFWVIYRRQGSIATNTGIYDAQ